VADCGVSKHEQPSRNAVSNASLGQGTFETAVKEEKLDSNG